MKRFKVDIDRYICRRKIYEI